MGGAGGSLRAGVTVNPVNLTVSVRESLTRVTCGGAPAYIWPGGGITFMADVMKMPEDSFRLRSYACVGCSDRVHSSAGELRAARRARGTNSAG